MLLHLISCYSWFVPLELWNLFVFMSFPLCVRFFVVDDWSLTTNFPILPYLFPFVQVNNYLYFSCLFCSARSRFHCCVECHSRLYLGFDWYLSVFASSKMGKKKESKEKQQKGFSSRCSSSSRPGHEQTASQDDSTGSTVISHDDDSLSGELAPALSQSSSGVDQRLGNSSVSSQRSHGTTSTKAQTRSDQGLTVPPPPDPTLGIWLVSMGFRLRPLT